MTKRQNSRSDGEPLLMALLHENPGRNEPFSRTWSKLQRQISMNQRDLTQDSAPTAQNPVASTPPTRIFLRKLCRSPSPRSIFAHPTLSLPFPAVDPKKLTEKIVARDWDAVCFHLQTSPRDAGVPLDTATTSLHQAIIRKAPLSVLEKLVQAWSRNLWIPDESGWLPIHLALLYLPDEASVVYLIRVSGHSGVDHNTEFGGSALYLACLHGKSVRIVRELLALGASVVTRRPQTPAVLLFSKFHRTAPERLWIYLNLMIAAYQGRPFQESDDRSLLLDDPYHPLYTLGDVMRFQIACSTPRSDYVRLYLERFPESVCVVDITTGMLPLHQVVQYDQADYIFDGLLARYPHAARVRDRHHRLPLHIAIEYHQTENVMEALLREYPQAVALARNTLFPFQEAARSSSSLDVTYRLLRACPNALHLAVEKSSM